MNEHQNLPEAGHPTECGACMAEFFASTDLQAKALHVARTLGDRMATAWVDEQLESIHAQHHSGEGQAS